MNSGKGLQSTATQSQSINSLARINVQSNSAATLPETQRLAPTQRLSGVCDNVQSQIQNLTLADPWNLR